MDSVSANRKPEPQLVTTAFERAQAGGESVAVPYPAGARKRLFIGLALGASIIFSVLLCIGWVIPVVGFGNIHPSLPYVTGLVFLAVILLILLGTIGLVIHVYTGKPFLFSRRFRGMSVRFFLPVLELVGRLGGISPEDVRHSFIKVNNEMLLTEPDRFAPDKILILLPHCIQRSACDLRLSHDVNHCRRCGLCPIGGLLDLRDRYGVHLAVATGGTIARRLVVEKRPRFILAVACERDLSSGIQDTYPLPVFGLLNERPNGPCFDTLVSLPMVESALRRFIRPENLPPTPTPPPRGDKP
ncbi:conserved hypothetical protein [uncultured delta proteobacterium]|uniref:DUF116 domain-containing protein n=1 Tax=uncultured delta proteobacterium TaxID=34034 RepID=A0A212JYV4_9DELT|nr:conserved hypothetical protein [uncultured delta proteobacterium]